MPDNRTFNSEEIRKILSKASQIQTHKDLYGDRQGLNMDELEHLAEEVGISREALIEALDTVENPDIDQNYEWLKATSRLQTIKSVEGSINDSNWEEVIHEIRKITGGIGKISKVGNSYEWEQRRSDIGYKHISFTPQGDKTKMQIVSAWGPFKFIASFGSFFFASIFTLVLFKVFASKELGLLLAPLGGLGGFTLSRFFLQSYFKNQKKQIITLTEAVTKKIRSFNKPSIQIENPELYSDQQTENQQLKDKS